MGRNRSPNRDKAFKIFKENCGAITSKELAKILGEKLCNINLWRVTDRWKDRLINKVGAQYCNNNAVGNNGGAPKKNQNSRKHGLYSKLMPVETYDIFEKIENMDPLDILWDNIKLKYAAILRSQKIMYVRDHDDLTKELKKIKSQKDNVGSKKDPQIIEVYREEEYDIQYAWDKQADFLRAQATAMGQLTNMIKKYMDLLHTNWDMATEEQKRRIEKLKVSVDTTKQDIENRKQVANEKLKLEKERFEHTKKMDNMKAW